MVPARESVRSFPYPVIEDGNLSYPRGEYRVQIKPRQDGRTVLLKHAVEKAALLERLLSEGKARYGCLVAVPMTGYRKLELSDSPDQEIELDMKVMGEPPMLRPVVVSVSEISRTLGAGDGVAEAWHGHAVTIPKGARLALGNYSRPASSLHGLLRLVEEPDLPDGCFEVKPCEEEGFYFRVSVAPDLRSFLNDAGEHQNHRLSVITHMASRCFEILAQEYNSPDEEEGKAKWESFSSLRALADTLQEKGLPVWDADSFSADKVATQLYPHRPPRERRLMSREPEYAEFEDSSYTSLRQNLIQSKGSDRQREFLSVLRSSSEFSGWIREFVEVGQGENPPLLNERLTEAQFKEPPGDIEELIFDTWKISLANASRTTFWGLLTLRHVEEGRIESSYLAANGGAGSGGLERINRALKEGTGKEIDNIVRSALRRMSGLQERGYRSVYVDCPFARAWWRTHLASEVSRESGVQLKRVVKVLTVSRGYWEKLVNLVVSRNSVLGDAKIRTALIWALSEFVDCGREAGLFQVKTLARIEKRLGVRLAWQELSVFSVKEIKEILEKELILEV